MLLREWTSRYNEYVNTTWGNAVNVFFLDDSTYEGINGNDTIASTWPIYWQDVGWAELGSDEAMRKVTHTQANCYMAKENVPHIHVRYSGAPDGAPRTVVDDLVPSSVPVETPTPSMSTEAPSSGFIVTWSVGAILICFFCLQFF
jgi:hypothetical protein